MHMHTENKQLSCNQRTLATDCKARATIKETMLIQEILFYHHPTKTSSSMVSPKAI